MTELLLPTIPVVLTTALIDSINPCAIGVLVLLIATLLKLSDNKKKMLAVGLIYITSVFLTYLIAGFGLLFFIQKLSISGPLTWIVSIIIILMGIIEIKDFFWYGKGISLSIPKKRAKQIKEYMQNVTIPGSIFLGIFVAAVELPCTGGPYLAITALLAKIGFSPKVVWLLVLYNFIFVLPLIIILLISFWGTNIQKVNSWKNQNKKWMRLFMGILMILLGIILIMWNNGSIGLV